MHEHCNAFVEHNYVLAIKCECTCGYTIITFASEGEDTMRTDGTRVLSLLQGSGSYRAQGLSLHAGPRAAGSPQVSHDSVSKLRS